MLPTIAAGREVGLELPEAGGEREWLKENIPTFEKKAADGDTEVDDMVKDVKERGLLQ